MALNKLTTKHLADNTIKSAKIADGAITDAKISESTTIPLSKTTVTGTQPTISGLSISQKSPSVAANVTITGTNFVSIPEVKFINQSTGARITASTVTYTSSTSLTVSFPADQSVASYKVYVENPGGLAVQSTATIINSDAPNWSTDASLGSYEEGESVNVQLLAYDDDSTAVTGYTLQSGSLPSGITLSGDSTIGSLSGTAPTVSADTAYNFTIRATDNESQTTDKAFNMTIADYNIGNTLLLNDGDSPSLTKSFGSAGNRAVWTWSAWIKVGAQAGLTNQFNPIFTAGDWSGGSTATGLVMYNNQFYTYWNAPNGATSTSGFYRDPSAWYHLVLVANTSTLKLYINGSEITSKSISGNGEINNGSSEQAIGKYSGSTSAYFDGYIGEVNFIDGTALTPTSFGEENSDGVWIPKKYTGSYGTNGFLLEYDSSGSLGTDTSGNGNNFTANNLAATDQMQDSPHLNYATLNPLSAFENDGTTYFNGNYTITEGNLKANSSGNAGNWGHAFSTIGMSAGKWYWEVKTTSISNSTHVGVSQLFTSGYFQNETTSRNINLINGASTGGAGAGAYNLSAFSASDILMIALDMDNGKVYFGKNGTWGNSGNPATATNPCFTGLDTTETYFAGFDIAYTGGFHWNFGSPGYSISSGNADGDGYGNFEYSVPTGYYALNSKNLATYG